MASLGDKPGSTAAEPGPTGRVPHVPHVCDSGDAPGSGGCLGCNLSYHV